MNDDSKLLQAARKMDRQALGQIFDLYARPLYHYALRLCHDPILADQIVGDVFAKLLDQIAAGNGPLTNVRAYLYEITHHLVIDEMRYSSRRVPLELTDHYWQTRISTNPDLENRVEVEEILVALHSLSADQRHVIILRILEDFSINETALIIGKSANSVKVIQHRAIKSLRAALKNKTSAPARASSPAIQLVTSAS